MSKKDKVQKFKNEYETKIRVSLAGMKCAIHNEVIKNLRFEWQPFIVGQQPKVDVKHDPCCDAFDDKVFAKLEYALGIKKLN